MKTAVNGGYETVKSSSGEGTKQESWILIHKIYGAVDVVVERLCGAEDFGESLRQVRSCDECVINRSHEAVVFESQKVGKRSVGGVAFWDFLQSSVHVDCEASVGCGKHLRGKLFPSVAYVLPDDRNHGWVVAVVARGEHVSVRIGVALACSEVEVVAGVHRLLTTGAKEHAQVSFIGSLVGGEACVAIDAVGAVFDSEVCDVIVERADFVNQFEAKLLPLL